MPAPARTRGARLTRRGRAVVVLTLLVLLVVGFSMGRVSSQATGHVDRPATVTVQPGESLWQLATRIAPHTDPRLVVSQLEQLNHLPGAEVFAGQQLIVPS
jgi:Na+-transporting methylmalonyl-CoA/oxaloacetate decarboxylase gamma subunit